MVAHADYVNHEDWDHHGSEHGNHNQHGGGGWYDNDHFGGRGGGHLDQRGFWGGNDTRGQGDCNMNRKQAQVPAKSCVTDILKPKAPPAKDNVLKLPSKPIALEDKYNMLKVPTKPQSVEPKTVVLPKKQKINQQKSLCKNHMIHLFLM